MVVFRHSGAIFYFIYSMAAGREACAPGGTVQGWHFDGQKYGILKFGRFWRICVRIADSDILHPLTLPQFWNHTSNCQCSMTPHKAVCTPRNLHC